MSTFEETQEKIEITLLFADDNDWFKCDFVENLHKYFTRKKCLTPKQLTALNSIIEKCFVMEWYNKKYPNGYDFEFSA